MKKENENVCNSIEIKKDKSNTHKRPLKIVERYFEYS